MPEAQVTALSPSSGGAPARHGPSPEPVARTQAAFAAVLAEVMRLDHVAADSHFFKDLGADSLVMAHFCARVRKNTGLPPVSMRDVYAHSTVRGLALALTAAEPPRPALAPSTPAPAAPSGRPRFVLCGALQLLTFLVYSCLVAFVGVRGYAWISMRLRRARRVSARCRLRRHGVPGAVPHTDPRQVGPRGALEAPADPYLEPGLLPSLGRQDTRTLGSARPLRRVAALHALPQGAGRADRAGRRGLLPPCAALYRSAVHR